MVGVRVEETASVRLRLEHGREVRGRVVSAFGPVPGARISIYPTNVPGRIVTTHTTDERGEFLIVLPPNAADLDVRVFPPGFAYTMGRVGYQPKKPLIVTVDQRGGTLVVNAPPDAALRLHHEGAMTWLSALRSSWSTSTRQDGSLCLEAMEPGAYTLCSESACTDGFLPPQGELRLTLN